MEYLAVRAVDEHAHPRRLRRPEPAGLVVVERRLLLLGREGDVVVAVEVVAIRRHPLEAPAHTLPVALQFLKRRARDRHQRHVAVAQMHHGAVVVVRPERAALAAFFPVRPEHEVIYEELVSPGEQVGHRLLARGPLENTRFANFHHGSRRRSWLRASRGRRSFLRGAVAIISASLRRTACEVLLLGEQDIARGKPLVSRHDLMRHGSISFQERQPSHPPIKPSRAAHGHHWRQARCDGAPVAAAVG